MADKEVKNVHREPHPFVGLDHLSGFIGKTIAFVGKVVKVEDSTIILKASNEDTVKIIRFKGKFELAI